MKKFSALFIMVAGCLWGTMGMFVRSISLSSMELVSLRAIATAIIMLIFLLIYDRKLLRIKIKDLWCFFGTGVCSILFFSYCYFTTISNASLALAAILLYTAPAMVMIMSAVLFRERINAKKLVSIMMAFVGCVLVTGVSAIADSNVTAGGILTGLGAGFGYALYSIFGRYALQRGYNALTVLCYTFIFAAAGTFFLCDAANMISYVSTDIKTLGFSLLFVVITTVLPYFLYTFGLKYVENSKASLIASVEPVVATLMGALFYNEMFSLGALVGAIMVLASALMSNINFKKLKKQ